MCRSCQLHLFMIFLTVLLWYWAPLAPCFLRFLFLWLSEVELYSSWVQTTMEACDRFGVLTQASHSSLQPVWTSWSQSSGWCTEALRSNQQTINSKAPNTCHFEKWSCLDITVRSSLFICFFWLFATSPCYWPFSRRNLRLGCEHFAFWLPLGKKCCVCKSRQNNFLVRLL